MAADRIPKEGVQIQKAMTAMLSSFPDDEQFELFDFVMAMAQKRRPDDENVWPELADQLNCFPGGAPEYLEGYEALLAQLPYLGDARQAEIITVLSTMLCDFDEANGYPSTKTSELYAILRERVLQLSPSRRTGWCDGGCCIGAARNRAIYPLCGDAQLGDVTAG
ncbi:hypothetical protein [Mycetohabitans sp. B2]|uniref:hypothetical protein n=1 Tax=Mycetohabitans sp. B2 TaxID=2841274 RepID=UPI001F38CD9C|nr:hypothetical protein [Mycetohabitans sp. B2]